MAKVNMACSVCGSHDVVKDAWAEWDVEKQEWVLRSVFDDTYCNDCEESHKLDEEPIDGPSGNEGDSENDPQSVSRDTTGDAIL